MSSSSSEKDQLTKRRRQVNNGQEVPGTYIHWNKSTPAKLKQRAMDTADVKPGTPERPRSMMSRCESRLDTSSEAIHRFIEVSKKHDAKLKKDMLASEGSWDSSLARMLEHVADERVATPPWNNVHLSRPATPRVTEDDEASNNYAELDMFRLSNVIRKTEKAMDVIDAARIALTSRPVTSVLLQIIQAGDWLDELLRHLHCIRDIYHMGTQKMFSNEVKQDNFFENIYRSCDLIMTSVSADKTVYMDRELINIRRMIRHCYQDGMSKTMLDHVSGRIRRRLTTAPRNCTVGTTETFKILPKRNSDLDSKDIDTDSHRCELIPAEEIDPEQGVLLIHASPRTDEPLTFRRPSVSPLAFEHTERANTFDIDSWPGISAVPLEQMVQKNDEKLQSLMADIDILMSDVGLQDRHDLTYEVVMMGGRHNPGTNQITDISHLYNPNDNISTIMGNNAIIANDEKLSGDTTLQRFGFEKSNGKADTGEKKSDDFITELDHLLDLC